ncbi:PucR family transcriptional regulator ligand-binding domain-containing protein [Pseudaeromonas sp. ZJS20]|uniref:PucR family transcriptional regulator n=1 Tax=Pseudaeromonas aegiceratis TaxID=3153928 RepID=UPI00390C9820
MTIRCADIPHLPGLESIRLRAGLQGSQQPIRWPYVVENDTLAPWVQGGELVFVTGINHRRSEENLKQLIREGVERQVAGMVILTGPEFIKEIPGPVLALANSLNFTLLEQPYALKMVLVTEVISNAIVQDNLLGQSVRLFLSRLINGFAEAPELIHLRAGELGLSDRQPYVVLALRAESQDPQPEPGCALLHRRQQLEQALSDLLQRRHVDWPVLGQDQDLLALWPTQESRATALDEELRQALAVLTRQFPDLALHLGISELTPDLSRLACAVDQARQAVQFGQQAGSRLFYSEQLGIARLFAAIPQRNLLAQFCREQLGVLCFAREGQPWELKQTLSQYLNQLNNQQEVAQQLGIHRNTLSYRLKRIEQLTGRSLSDPFSRLNLQNALLIEQILLQHHHIHQAQP